MKTRKIALLTIIMAVAGILLGIYGLVFTTRNLLTGIILLLLALMMLKHNMTYRPFNHFIAISAVNVIIGISAYLTVIHPFAGIVLSFLTVVFIILATMTNLKSPTYLAFLLLFVAQMVRPSATMEELGVRLVSLVVGSLFVVLLNLAINIKKTPANMIKKACDNPENLIESSIAIKKEIYGYFTSIPGNESYLKIANSLEQIGIVLKKKTLTQKQWAQLKDGLKGKPFENLPKGITINLKIIQRETDSSETIHVPELFRIRFMIKSIFRIDNVRLNFALRMGILIALFEFVGVYFHIPNYRWFVFTVVPIVQPYIDNVSKKSRMKIFGNLCGIGLFAVLYTILGHYVLIAVIFMMYLFIILPVKRTDVRSLVMTNFSLSIAAASLPLTTILTERFFFVPIATLVSLIATYLILPYSLERESRHMVKNYEIINGEQINNLKNVLLGKKDRTAIIDLKTLIVSEKIAENNLVNENDEISRILKLQNKINVYCSFLTNVVSQEQISPENRKMDIDIIENRKKPANFNDDIGNTIYELVGFYDESVAEISRMKAGK